MSRIAARIARITFWVSVAGCLAGAAAATRLGTRWPTVYVTTDPSMSPTIAQGATFVAWSPADGIERGALVLFRFPDEGEVHHVLRRVAALPGDTVAMADGAVLVNGRRQPWPFLILAPRVRRSALARVDDLYTWGPWIVPADSVVVLADTRDVVGWPDSRFVGFVAIDDVVARAWRTVSGRKLR